MMKKARISKTFTIVLWPNNQKLLGFLFLMTLLKKSITILAILITAHSIRAQDENGVFEIDEINVSFLDKKSFETDIVKGIMALKEGDDFDEETYLQDIERIRKFYFDNGFFDVSVDTSLSFNSDSREVVENFRIREGARYTINELTFKGLDDVSQEVTGRIFQPGARKIYDGGYYSRDTIKQEIIRIIDILQNNGYALAQSGSPEILKYETNIPEMRNKVNISIPFDHGDIYVFGKTVVVFRGEKYNVTMEDVTRELTYKQGNIYKKDEIINSEVNLSKMSILENPRIVISRIDSADRIIDFKLDIYVSNKYELVPELFSYYFRNYLYGGAGLSLSDKNFFGGGRVLTTAVRAYYNSPENYRLEWINTLFQPFLFGNKNTSGSWNIGLKYISEEVSGTSTFTNLFSISHNLPTYTYLNRIVGSWESDFDNIQLKKDVQSDDSLVVPAFSFNAVNSTLSLGLIHNSTNNLQFPFKGNFQSYDFEDSGLMSALFRQFINAYINSYFKMSVLSSFYFNLSNKDYKVPSALATKFFIGSIFEYGDNTFEFVGQTISGDRIPDDERFVCGGSSSVRGWGARQLGIVADKDIGGNFLIETSIEHRIRPFLDVSNIYFRDLGFATFIDIGNVWSEIQKFKLNEIAMAAGAGIRYYTIIGAIRLDLGFKIYDPQPGKVGGSKWIFGEGANLNDKYQFQFGIGNTF